MRRPASRNWFARTSPAGTGRVVENERMVIRSAVCGARQHTGPARVQRLNAERVTCQGVSLPWSRRSKSSASRDGWNAGSASSPRRQRHQAARAHAKSSSTPPTPDTGSSMVYDACTTGISVGAGAPDRLTPSLPDVDGGRAPRGRGVTTAATHQPLACKHRTFAAKATTVRNIGRAIRPTQSRREVVKIANVSSLCCWLRSMLLTLGAAPR